MNITRRAAKMRRIPKKYPIEEIVGIRYMIIDYYFGDKKADRDTAAGEIWKHVKTLVENPTTIKIKQIKRLHTGSRHYFAVPQSILPKDFLKLNALLSDGTQNEIALSGESVKEIKTKKELTQLEKASLNFLLSKLEKKKMIPKFIWTLPFFTRQLTKIKKLASTWKKHT